MRQAEAAAERKLKARNNKKNYRGYDWQNCQSQDQTYNQCR
jgi:hypothetical protein